MPANVFSIKIGGEAGQGIKSAGLLLAKFAVRAGYHVYNYLEYPSLIRGGHNVMQINIGAEEVTGPFAKCDFLIALDQNTVDKHVHELTPGAGIIYESTKELNTSDLVSTPTLYPIPLMTLAKEAGGNSLLENTVALGAVVEILEGNLSTLKNLLTEEFADKGENIVRLNVRAAQAGYDFAKREFADKLITALADPKMLDSPIQEVVLNGNEAVALGAISAGLQFSTIYPMSPISGIIDILAENQEKHGYIFKQPEDEISAINMAIGASFGGARALTATSGGGFCLMTEGYGLAGMTETPLVIVNGMRGGPSTGLPTWSEQGDLQFVLHAHQGEFPKIILAAGDAKEAFELTAQAFNLADKYQTPVVILLDKNICDNDQSFLPPNTSNYQINRGKKVDDIVSEYCRYRLEPDGISPKAFAGSGNYFISNSYEHDEQGFSTEDIKKRNKQMEKRMKKLKTCTQEDMPSPEIFGPKNAELTIVSWGSNKGSILQALKNFPNVNYLHLTWISPFPAEKVRSVLQGAKRILNIECNYSAQMANLIKEKTDIEIGDQFLKHDGRPFFVEEIEEKIRSMLKGKGK